eukprot:GHRR01004916.1.p1 GENE.GHRR01004916.1~~GHRR01004916.1.p1  ORF type:complete len:373 (+),score=82.48 GHRR01004916.1:886-2004(+)
MGCNVPVLLVLLLLCSTSLGQSANAPLGSYLGCFTLMGLGLRSSDMRAVMQLAKDTLAGCADTCSKQQHSLAIVTTDYKCRCSSIIPDMAAKLPDQDCNQGGMGVAVFYLHKNADTTMCHLAEVPLTHSDSFSIAYGQQNVQFDPVGTRLGTMGIRLAGTQGSRLTTKDGDFLYGQYQVRGRVSGAPGVVAGFYTRSSDLYPNEAAGQFSEIDFEFLNGYPAAPCSVWTNVQTNGLGVGEQNIPVAEYQKVLAWPQNKTTCNNWVTYTFNWQPDSVSWYLDGRPVRMERNGDVNIWTDMGGTKYERLFQSPNKASHVTFSVWTDDRGLAQPFGGAINQAQGPYWQYFKQLRRILCDKPATAASKGPAWLYSS